MEGTGDYQKGSVTKQDTSIFPKKEASTAPTVFSSWRRGKALNQRHEQTHREGSPILRARGAGASSSLPRSTSSASRARTAPPPPVPRCHRGGVSTAPASATHLRPAGSARGSSGTEAAAPWAVSRQGGREGGEGRRPRGRRAGAAPTAARKAQGFGCDVREAAPRPPCPRPALTVGRARGRAVRAASGFVSLAVLLCGIWCLRALRPSEKERDRAITASIRLEKRLTCDGTTPCQPDLALSDLSLYP